MWRASSKPQRSISEKSPMILETERHVLRYQQPSDITALAELWTDPEVTEHMGGPRDRAKLLAALEEAARDREAEPFDLWPVVEKETGEVVGDCGLLDKEVGGKPAIELVYVIRRASWGQGYATEIAQPLKQHTFERLGLSRLVALIEPGNVASERVAIKVGMRLEKEVVRPGGAVRLLYALEASGETGMA
jgi:RimJ/RimL family protein N-acetyltransferase